MTVRSKIHEIFMPALSSTMTEGKIVSWIKTEGEKLAKGESVTSPRSSSEKENRLRRRMFVNWQRLSVCLLYEMSKGKSSFWYPYLLHLEDSQSMWSLMVKHFIRSCAARLQQSSTSVPNKADLVQLLSDIQTQEKQKLHLAVTIQVLLKAGRPSERMLTHENYKFKKPMQHECMHFHEITEDAGTEEAEADAEFVHQIAGEVHSDMSLRFEVVGIVTPPYRFRGAVHDQVSPPSPNLVLLPRTWSEKFKIVNKAEDMVLCSYSTLVNFKGKLGAFVVGEGGVVTGQTMSIELWVLVDAEKREWSKHLYVLPPLWKNVVAESELYFVGVTGEKEIVFSMLHLSDPFYVYYYNIEENTITRVEIQGMSGFKNVRVRASLDHVEDVKLMEYM
ncbi:hypothetical protein Bca4012_057189 [Brassica carinata]